MNVHSPFGPVQVREFGDPAGRPVLALHPLAMSGRLFERAGEWVAPLGLRLIAPDLPAPGPLDGLGVADLAISAVEPIARLGLDRVDVVGMSMGGCVALQVALDQPTLVSGLVLADTTSSYGPGRVDAWEQRARLAEQTPRAGLLDFQLPRWFTDDFRETDPDECARLAKIFTTTTPAVHAASCRALGAFDVTPRLGAITAPTLVLVGEQDYATPPAMSENLQSHIAGSRLSVLPGVRHFSLVESHFAWEQIAAHLTV